MILTTCSDYFSADFDLTFDNLQFFVGGEMDVDLVTEEMWEGENCILDDINEVDSYNLFFG